MEAAPKTVYFGSCGVNGIPFFVGVYRCLQHKHGLEGLRGTLFLGDEIGAVFALCMALELDYELVDTITYRYYSRIKLGEKKIQRELEFLIESVFGIRPNAFEAIRYRCKIGHATMYRHYWTSSWNDSTELMNCITQSCRSPFYFKNNFLKYLIDVEGMHCPSDDLPAETLFVGSQDPFADIRPLYEVDLPIRGDRYDSEIYHGFCALSQWCRMYTSKKVQKKINPMMLMVIWVFYWVEYFALKIGS